MGEPRRQTEPVGFGFRRPVQPLLPGDRTRRVVEEGRMQSTETLAAPFRQRAALAGRAGSRTHSPWVSRLLTS